MIELLVAGIINASKPTVLQQIEPKPIVQIETQPQPPPEPTIEEKVANNVNGCDTDVQYIRADNAECLDKPTATVQKPAITPDNSPQSISTNGNTYAPGYCTYGVKMWRPDIPNRLGDANMWYANAQRLGMAVGSTPRVGAVAQQGNHVALVIGVSGSSITVKEMNYQRLWDVNIRTTSASLWRYIY